MAPGQSLSPQPGGQRFQWPLLPQSPIPSSSQLSFLEKAILGSAQQVLSVGLKSTLMSVSQSVLVRCLGCLCPWQD